jgi:hypothetical protein
MRELKFMASATTAIALLFYYDFGSGCQQCKRWHAHTPVLYPLVLGSGQRLTKPLRGSSGTAAEGELLNGSFLSERMWIITPLPLETGVSDGYDEPSAPAHDRGHDGPQSVALDPAFLHLCGCEVQPSFRLSTGSARHGRCPCQLHLIEQKFSWSHINQVACALRFFYGITLGQKDPFERIVCGKEPEKVPPVLNREEIARFLNAIAGLRNRVAVTTAYAAGLRIGEVARLKVGSIDSERITSRVPKAARIATRCCRPGSSRSSARIGSVPGQVRGYFRAWGPAIT